MNKKYYIVNDEIFKSLNFIHLLLSIIRDIIVFGCDFMKKVFYSLVILLCIIFITGCNEKGKIDNKMDKYEKLSNYLIGNGWEKSENDQYGFSLKARDFLDDEGKPVNVDWYDLDIKKMNIQRATRISQLAATTTDYSLKSNIATGTYILLNEKDEWDRYASFTYDFNSGSLTISDDFFSSSCTSDALHLKEYLESIIENSNLSVEDFK